MLCLTAPDLIFEFYKRLYTGVSDLPNNYYRDRGTPAYHSNCESGTYLWIVLLTVATKIVLS